MNRPLLLRSFLSLVLIATSMPAAMAAEPEQPWHVEPQPLRVTVEMGSTSSTHTRDRGTGLIAAQTRW